MGQFVAGDLLDDEFIVGHIVVEGIDDPIAIKPNVAQLVFFETVGIGIARGIEPQTAPAFAVVRRGQQALDLFFVGINAFVSQKRIDFSNGWGQANQIQA